MNINELGLSKDSLLKINYWYVKRCSETNKFINEVIQPLYVDYETKDTAIDNSNILKLILQKDNAFLCFQKNELDSSELSELEKNILCLLEKGKIQL